MFDGRVIILDYLACDRILIEVTMVDERAIIPEHLTAGFKGVICVDEKRGRNEMCR